MSVFEIVAGVVLAIACLIIIGMVLSQRSKGQGLSSVITGGDMMSGGGYGSTKEQRQVRITRIMAVVLFIVTIAVNFVSAFAQ